MLTFSKAVKGLWEQHRSWRDFLSGGEKGIRTPGAFSCTHAFQAWTLSHSAISPKSKQYQKSKNLSGFELQTITNTKSYFRSLSMSLVLDV
jgi:hypothetical protein